MTEAIEHKETMPYPIEIELAKPEDAEQIADLLRRTWIATYPNEAAGITEEDIRGRIEGAHGERIPERIVYWRENIEKAGDDRAIFVARQDGQVIGMAAVGKLDNEGNHRLYAMYVSPESQGQGVGAQLIDRGLSWLGRDKDIYLDVADYNRKAINFYEEHGFRQTGKHIEDTGNVYNGKKIPQIEMVRVADNGPDAVAEASNSEKREVLSSKAVDSLAAEYGVAVEDIVIDPVGGGYSLNRRALVTVNSEVIFIKEVDTDILEGDGQMELGWLKKDFAITQTLRNKGLDIVSEWSKLLGDGHLLVLPGYPEDTGWKWKIPDNPEHVAPYITSVLKAVRSLENTSFSEEEISKLKLKPFIRDDIVLDTSLKDILQDDHMRAEIIQKISEVARDASVPWLQQAALALIKMLEQPSLLAIFHEHQDRLAVQPQNIFGHSDVRSDNIAYHPETGQIRFVDWNWASMTPQGFGETEFLADMVRHGVDVSQWSQEINADLAGSLVAFYLRRCIKPALSEDNSLREMQAHSAVANYMLLEIAT